jgi:DNA repair exonuclease SbcCD ATPase subunit
MAREVSAKSTKTEILDAYEELVREHQALQAHIEELRAGQQTAIPRVPPVIEAKPLTEAVKGATVHEVMQGLSALRAGFGSAISALSAQLTTEATKLAELQRGVVAQTSELKALHDLEVTEQTLDELLQKYAEESERFDADMQQQRQAFEQEMAEQRAAWQKEQEAQARFLKERDASLRRAREREAAEYAYARERTRKQDTDTYEQQQKKLSEALDELDQSKQRDWEAREQAIADQEKLFAEYQTKVEAFPAELEATVQKAAAEGRRLVEAGAKIQADLQAQEIAGEKRIAELRIKALRETIDKQAVQIDNLTKQLNAVLKQAQDLAVKALEGASTSGSYQAIREIALEQAKTLQKTTSR